jgi:hypothetical protein
VQAVGDRLTIIYLLERVIVHKPKLARMDLRSREELECYSSAGLTRTGGRV